jgi:hypothetical protein
VKCPTRQSSGRLAAAADFVVGRQSYVGQGRLTIKRFVFLLIGGLAMLLASTVHSQLSGKCRVVAASYPDRYFVVETLYLTPRHYGLVELYEGAPPRVGDVLVGEFRTIDRDIYNVGAGLPVSVRVLLVAQRRDDVLAELRRRVRNPENIQGVR